MASLSSLGVASPASASKRGRVGGGFLAIKRLAFAGTTVAIGIGLFALSATGSESFISQAQPWLALVAGGSLGWVLGSFVASQRAGTTAMDRPASLPTFEEAEEAMRRELNRARRSQYPVGVVVLWYRDSQQALVGLANRLSQLGLRDTDIWALALSERQIIAVTPETNRAQALYLVGRLVEALPRSDRLRLLCATAVFPEDGLGLSVLLERARLELSTARSVAEQRAGAALEQQQDSTSTEVRGAA